MEQGNAGRQTWGRQEKTGKSNEEAERDSSASVQDDVAVDEGNLDILRSLDYHMVDFRRVLHDSRHWHGSGASERYRLSSRRRSCFSAYRFQFFLVIVVVFRVFDVVWNDLFTCIWYSGGK